MIQWDRNDPDTRPGDPYPYQGGKNPFTAILQKWHSKMPNNASAKADWSPTALVEYDRTFRLGTTSVEATDEKGWAVSVAPSGGWTPAVIAGHTGVGPPIPPRVVGLSATVSF